MTTTAGASMELFGAKTENCIRTAIALEEAGLPYTATLLNLRAGEQRSETFLSLNPAGKVPVLVARREGEPAVVLSQSTAIMLYAARAGLPELLPEDESAASGRAMERFFYVITDVVAPSHASSFAAWHGFEKMGALHLQRSVNAFALCEQFVHSTCFLAGDMLTLADIAAVTFAKFNQPYIDWTNLPALRNWYERVESRPAVQRGLRAFDPQVNLAS